MQKTMDARAATSTSTRRAGHSPRQPANPRDSPGFSTMVSNGNRVTAPHTDLRADHPQLLTAILPHEVTHVVLADLFTVQQIPRWADEGIAVLAEPRAEQQPPRGRAARAPANRPGLRAPQAHVDGLPRRQGLEPLLRPERLA